MFLRTICLFVPVLFALAQAPPPAPDATPSSPATHGEPGGTVAVPPDKVVLTVGETKITAAQFDQIVGALPEQVRAAARGASRTQFANSLVQLLTLAQEAKRRKLDETPEFKTLSEFQNLNILASLAFDQIGSATKPSEAQVRKYYDDHKADYEQVRARHILIRTPGSPVPLKEGQTELTDATALSKAQSVRSRIEAGEDFAKVAAETSDDSGAANNGGDLGTFGHGQMVPAFETAAFALKPGELSVPVKTQFGYHIIQVQSHETKGFQDVREELENQLGPAEAQKAVQELVKSTPHSLDSSYFPPAAPSK